MLTHFYAIIIIDYLLSRYAWLYLVAISNADKEDVVGSDMKLYVVPALLACGLNTVLASIVFSLSVYHLYTDQNVNPPVAPNREWMHLIKLQIPFAAGWMALGLIGMYVSMTKKQLWSSTVILLFLGLWLGFAIYFAITFGNQLDVENLDPEGLFKLTLKEVLKKGEDGWIPEWLDNIQKKSTTCCGIKTFRDYEEFWPSTASRLPRSCCKEAKSIPAACPKDITFIPFPNTPDDYFKVETGCMDEIMEIIRHHSRESYQNSIIMATFIAVTLFAFGVLYTRRYLDGPTDPKTKAAIVIEGGDGAGNGQLETNSEPIAITSSGELVGPMDSAEGVVIGSREALISSAYDTRKGTPGLPGPVLSASRLPTSSLQKQQLKQFQQMQQQQFRGPGSQMNQSTLQIQIRQQPVTQSQQQLSPIQLQQLQQQYQQQQQSLAGSGVDMNRRDTYGGLGSRSYATDQSNPIPTPSTMANLPQTASLDNIDQDLRADQLQSDGTGSPPGSPGQVVVRKKRVRRDGMPSRNKPAQ